MRGADYTGQEVTLAVNQALNIGLADAPRSKSIGGVTLWGAIFGALLGGLILNLMPCVFPIISLKALSLSKTAHSGRNEARRDAWLYTAGVLATFTALVLLLLALKAAGNSLGWGFQLQSPKVTGVLALLMFVIGLNLLGVFEFGARLQNTGQELTTKSGPAGSFFTGALAVIVATPCTAPFMAGAMGYALAQPALITLLVFLALGVGFALPFLLLGYVPQLLAKLPKPGPWMARFKEFLAFPMFATAIWLAWVMGNQAGTDGLLKLLIAALLIGFALWLLRRGSFGKLLGAAALLAAITIPLTLGAQAKAGPEKNAQAWSPAAVQEALAEGRPVFVDFTADWCVTCKVNERLVINTDKTRALFERTDTAFLIADWTNKNDMIAQELAKYDRAGVPLYLVYHPDQNSVMAEVLPQILTYDVLETALGGTKERS
jgi:thiol:disulfide interchange protein DsbD